MPEYNGTLQAFELASTLWLIPALPLLAALVVAVGRALPPDDPRRPRLADDRLVFIAVAASLAVAVANAVELVLLPPFKRFLLDPLWTLIRSGSLDVTLSFAFDPLAAVCCVAIALVGVGVVLHAGRSAAGSAHVPALALAVGGAELLVLADNLPLMLIGWHVAGLATWILIGGRTRGGRLAFGVARLGDAALIAGAAMLFWSLGGSWVNGSFTPDYRPRLIGVLGAPSHEAVQGTVHAENTGTLTVSALPGARVHAGAADVCAVDSEGRPGGLGFSARPCREPATTPFWRLPIPPARHDVRIDAGPGTNQLLVDKLRVTSGEHTAVALVGPTLVFRELADQLRIHDGKGEATLAGQLTAKRLWGFPALLLACALLAVAALSRAAQLPFGSWLEGAARAPAAGAALIAGATGTLGGVYLLARLSFYLAMVPDLTGLIALIGALTMLIAGARAIGATEPRVVLMRVAIAQTGLAIVGVAGGAASAGALQLAVHALAIGAWLLVADATGDDVTSSRGLAKRAPRLARAATLATLAAAGVPWPFVGTFWSRGASLWAVFEGTTTGFLPGAVVYAIALAGAAAISFALWRLCLVIVGGGAKSGAAAVADPLPPVALWLAGAALAVGLLGATDAVLGGTSLVAPIASFIGSSADTARLGAGMRGVLLVVSFAVPLFVWSLARRAYGPNAEHGPDDADATLPGHAWLRAEPRAASRAFAGLAHVADRAGRDLVVLDELLDVVLGAPARLLAGREPALTPDAARDAAPDAAPDVAREPAAARDAASDAARDSAPAAARDAAPEKPGAQRDAGRAGPASPSKRSGKKRKRGGAKGKG